MVMVHKNKSAVGTKSSL